MLKLPRFHLASSNLANCFRFQRALASRTGIPLERFDHYYEEIAKKFNICSSKQFREYQDVLFLFGLLSNYIDNFLVSY